MESIAHEQFILEYQNAFRNPNFIPMVEEEARQDWGYLQWTKASTGDSNQTRISDYRSNLNLSLNQLFVPLEECQVERMKPLIQEMASINKKLEECIWHYRNAFNIHVTRNEGYNLLKYGRGAEYKGHVDHSENNGRVFSIVAFMNDVEDGGELVFPFQEIEIKPKAGSVVAFPSNFPFYHYAKPTGENSEEIKYSMVTWFS
jgi:hypothetical protein